MAETLQMSDTHVYLYIEGRYVVVATVAQFHTAGPKKREEMVREALEKRDVPKA